MGGYRQVGMLRTGVVQLTYDESPAMLGVPAVLEQKITILWKCLYLLVSLQGSSGVGGA